ncbi:outer membrane beta-barrel protein [Vibrio jasicida]|uniref:outer membrane beta-barrel protein n=1 Tax=Vibrio jasicida TaxID=766224 RepID=UPI0040691F59
MNNAYLTTLFLVLPLSLHAQETSKTTPYYVKGGLTASILENSKRESEAFGYEAMLGYQFNEYIFAEAGYQSFDAIRDDEHDMNGLSAELNGRLPVSGYASLYAGGGVSLMEGDANPSAQIGLQYQLSDNWSADVSYQGIFGIDAVDDDLYAFNLSFLYRFPSSQLTEIEPGEESIEDVYITQASNVKDEEQSIKPEAKNFSHTLQSSHKDCYSKNRKYELVKGDYLLKIARENEVELQDILLLNPYLEGRNINLVYPGEEITYPHLYCE